MLIISKSKKSETRRYVVYNADDPPYGSFAQFDYELWKPDYSKRQGMQFLEADDQNGYPGCNSR